jgi:group I intron endonuclease
MKIENPIQPTKTPIVGIYKITSPKGKVYIGQSTDIKKRFNDYRLLKCKPQKALYNSLAKYGTVNHTFEIIEECDELLLNEKEIDSIAQHKCFNTKSGMNLKSGGQGGRWSDESKANISKTKTGVPNHKISGEGNGMFGKKHSAEVRLASSLRNSGEKHPFFGKHRSEETKRKIGDASLGEKNKTYGKPANNLGKPHSEATKTKMREAAAKRKLRDGYKGKIGNVVNYDIIKIQQLSIKDEPIKLWDNFAQIEKELGFIKRTIRVVCMGINHSYMGYKWRFCREETNLIVA